MDYSNEYRLKHWGGGYFGVNSKGHVTIKPYPDGPEGDLYELTSALVERGIEAPILIRFNDILKNRIQCLHAAFQSAIEMFDYRSDYRMAFPVKVNPQCHVVEIVLQGGKDYLIGLEVGSKPELIGVITSDLQDESLLLCNGYKDLEYISLALMARKVGKRTIIIIEQLYELKLVLTAAEQLGVEAEIGIRMKLSNKGAGRWDTSGGEQSKFGLFTHEIVACLEQLEAAGKADWFKLLHFHLGSQVPTIEAIKKALNEGARMYTELAREYPSLCFFDVGGGLAIDYDGSKSASNSSMNYSIDEYARDVVSVIGEACLQAGVDDPIIITESGRAIASQHSVLITEVIDVASMPRASEALDSLPSKHAIVEWIYTMYQELSSENCRETFHDAMELKERVLEEFIHGKLTLKERAYTEKVYRMLIAKIRLLFDSLSEAPDELETLDKLLRETYFCNFSVFQSLPDSWAISQLFPVMPLHRLLEKPTHKAVLADISCDSDGKIDCFAGRKHPNSYIMLHEYASDPYYLGIFMVGAYQEILGGLHNLFGDTNVVHVELNREGEWEILRQVEGDKIEEVLGYVQYKPDKLQEHLQVLIEKAVRSGKLSPAESAGIKKKFKMALESYTYLVV